MAKAVLMGLAVLLVVVGWFGVAATAPGFVLLGAIGGLLGLLVLVSDAESDPDDDDDPDDTALDDHCPTVHPESVYGSYL